MGKRVEFALKPCILEVPMADHMPDGALPGLAPAEGHGGIFTVRASGNVRGWNGIQYKAGLSNKFPKSRK